MTAIRLACFTLFAVASAASGERSLDAVRFKFEVALEQQEKEATGRLDAGFRKGLEDLRGGYRERGDLDAVLEIRSITEAIDAGKPLPEITRPKVKGLYDVYHRRRAQALREQTLQGGKLYAIYLTELLKIEAGGGDDAAAASEEIAQVKEVMREVEQATRFAPGARIRGRMHINVDDKVTLYVDGERWKTFMRNPSNKGSFVSEIFEFTVGDRLLVSARNSRGGLRHVKIVFVSEDEKEMIEFRVADFTDLHGVIGDRRDFTLDELKSHKALPARRDADKSGNPFDFENGSEWPWGNNGNHALLGTVIKAEMCRLR